MLNIIKRRINYYIFTFSALSLTVLTACSPHPATGTWLSSATNSENYSKMIVHFEPRLEIYSGKSDKPTLFCGWSGLNKNSITLECMSAEEQKQMDMYQINITQDAQAELVYEGKIIAKFDKSDE